MVTQKQIEARRKNGRNAALSGQLVAAAIAGGFASQKLRTPEQRIEFGQRGADKVGIAESTRQGKIGGIKGAQLAGSHEMKRRSIWALHLRHHIRKHRVNEDCPFCPDLKFEEVTEV